MVKHRAVETRPMIVRISTSLIAKLSLDQPISRCRTTFTYIKQSGAKNMEDEGFR